MHTKRRFWQESDSSAPTEQPFELLADDARGRQRMIGVELRLWYRKVADEPVPAEWLDLLNQGEGIPQTLQSESIGST